MEPLKTILLKRISTLSYRTLEYVTTALTIIYFLFISLIATVFNIDINNVFNIFLVMGIYFALLLGTFSLMRDFRKQQIQWLKEHGGKIYGSFTKVRRSFGLSDSVRVHWIIYTKAIVDSKVKIFGSDITPYGNIYWFGVQKKVEKIVTNYLQAHPEGITIYINTEHPNIYWVDANWLVTIAVDRNVAKKSWTFGAFVYLIIIACIYLVYLLKA